MRKLRSLMAFQKAFPDEAACDAFLVRRRWPKGFICPECGGGQADDGGEDLSDVDENIGAARPENDEMASFRL